LTLSGAVAQYGRGVGIIQMTAAQIITQFANNLKAQLAKEGGPTAPADAPATSSAAASPAPPRQSPAPAQQQAPPPYPPPQAGEGKSKGPPPLAGERRVGVKPISGFALMANVLWGFLRRLF